MEKIKGLAIELDLDHLAVDRGLRGLKDNLRTVNSEMKRNMSAFDRSEKSVEKYETRLEGLNKKLEVQKVAVSEAQKEYEKMVEQHGRGSKEAEKAAREYNNQAASLNNLERYIERTKDELVRFEREQRIANSTFTKLGDKLEAGSKQLERAGRRMGEVGSTLTNRITKPALGAATALASLTIFKGFQRLTGIDTARAKLDGLGHDAKAVEEIMTSALDSVRGTAFGMDEAATSAASAVAARIKPGKDLTRYLSIAGDAAAIAGSSLGEMGSIFGKVQTAQKAYTGELNQLADRGIPIFQWLADEAEVSAEAVRDMASKGKVSSEMFLSAIENNIGGAAKTIGGKSFVASVKNIGSDIGRIGANFLDAGGKGGGFFSKLKPMLVDFRGYLEQAEDKASDLGIKFGQAFENMVEKAKELKRNYDELSPAQQDFLNKVLLIAPAVAIGAGPALKMFSNLTLGASKLMDMTGRLSKAIGVARGAGLAAGLSSLGPLAVGGIALAGITALAGGIYLLTRDTDNLHKVNYDLINSVEDEVQAISNLEERFSELHGQNRLTADEMLRYMDIMSELESAEGEKAIKKLTDEQDALLQKSGFTNEEMEDFLELNNKIIEETPNVTSAISDQGNAFIDNLDILKELNAEKIESLMIDAQRELEKALENENELLQKQIDLANEIEQTQADINTTQEERLDLMPELTKEQAEQRRIDQEMKNLKEEIEGLDGQALKDAQAKYLQLEDEKLTQDEIVRSLEQQKGWLDKEYDQLRSNLDEKIKSLDNTEKELEKIQILIGDYEQLILKQVGLNSEKGEGVDTINEEIQRQRDLKKELENTTDEALKNTDEYRNAREEINKQIGRLERAKQELEEINTLAGQTIYDKKINISTSPSLDSFEKNWSRTISRRVNINPTVNQGYLAIPTYAKGTPSLGHKGGPAIVGDGGGPELITTPKGKSFLSPGTDTLLDLPKGSHVLPHSKTLSLLKNIPKYASGTSGWLNSLGNSEFARLLTLNKSSDSNVVVHGEGSNSGMKELLRETIKQNDYLQKMLDLLMSLLDKDFEAVLAFEPFYNAVKQRINEDNYSQRKQRRR